MSRVSEAINVGNGVVNARITITADEVLVAAVI